MNAIKFVEGSQTEIEGLLAPYNGPFAGKDLSGEFFSPKTDFVLDLFPDGSRPVMYHHGLNKIGPVAVGRIKKLSKTDLGLWMQAELDAANEYYGAIRDLVDQGILKLSSGSLPHLVKLDRKSGEILTWPVIEGSLTPTPANPGATVDWATAKAHFKALDLDLPDDLAPKEDASKAVSMSAMRRMAKEMGMEMSDEEMQAMMDANPDADEEAMRSMMEKRKGKGKSVTLKAASWEDVKGEIAKMCQERLNMNPFGMGGWCDVECTYSDHAIVEIYNMDPMGMSKSRYFSVPFILGPDGHVVSIGEAMEMEETYVPKERSMDGMSMSKHADLTVKYAASLSERTKDLRDRRLKEGRMLSGTNRQRLQTCVESMGTAMTDLQALLDATEPQPAKAASVERLLALWNLYL